MEFDKNITGGGARGYSLIETMIAIAIGSVAFAGLTTYVSTMSDYQGFLDGKIDSRTLLEEVRQTLNNPASCLAAFGAGFTINPTAAAPGQLITSLELPNGEILRSNGGRLERYALLSDDLRLTEFQRLSPTQVRAVLVGRFRSANGQQMSMSALRFGMVSMTVNASNQLTACSLNPEGSTVAGPGLCASLGGIWQSQGQDLGSCILCAAGLFSGFQVDPNGSGGVRVSAICSSFDPGPTPPVPDSGGPAD